MSHLNHSLKMPLFEFGFEGKNDSKVVMTYLFCSKKYLHIDNIWSFTYGYTMCNFNRPVYASHTL